MCIFSLCTLHIFNNGLQLDRVFNHQICFIPHSKNMKFAYPNTPVLPRDTKLHSLGAEAVYLHISDMSTAIMQFRGQLNVLK